MKDTYRALKEARLNEFSYTLSGEDGSGEFCFRYSPEYALKLGYGMIYDPNYGEAVKDAFGVALAFYDTLNFTERERAIASAFFGLGMVVEQPIQFQQECEDKLSEVRPRIAGGKHSPYSAFKREITLCVQEHIDNNQPYKQTLNKIESLKCRRPAERTLRGWIKNLQDGKPIF